MEDLALNADMAAMQERAELVEQEFEISKELLAMQDNAEQHNESESGDTQGVEINEAPTKSELEQAEAVAVDIAGFAFGAIQAATGNSYGLDEKAAQKWAHGVAPCLVKYRLTDTSAIFNKWEAEVKAAIATGAVIFGIVKEHKQYQKALENGNKSQ